MESALPEGSAPGEPPSNQLRLIGAHMPSSGGLSSCLLSGREIGCTAVQLFTGNPRQWSHPPLAEEEIRAFQNAREETALPFLCAHDSYLINLAAPDADVLDRSRNAFRGELERAHALGIPWVVTHMGAHLERGEEEAVARLIESLVRILEETDAAGCTAGIALETTAGQGTGLGWRFEQLGAVLKGVDHQQRIGVCMDTCHIFAAGYDLRTEDAWENTLKEFDAQVGLSALRIIHANDSKKGLGSRVDRHEHIGKGEIGLKPFARLVRDARLQHVPVVVETPDAHTMHQVNVALLQRLAAGGTGVFVEVELCGHFSEAGPLLQMELPENTSLQQLAEILEQKDARLAGLSACCQFAVNHEFAERGTLLCEGDRVAALPPSSGG